MKCRAYSIVAASVAVVSLLSDVTGARGQGTGGPASEVQTIYYRLHAADLFLNASFGLGPEFSQSGKGGPSVFPNTSVGARFAVKPLEGVVLRTAVLDGVPVERPTGWDIFAKGDGLLIVSEAAFLYRPSSDAHSRLPHRFLLGRDAHSPQYVFNPNTDPGWPHSRRASILSARRRRIVLRGFLTQQAARSCPPFDCSTSASAA